MEQTEELKTPRGGYDLGTWLGRNQAFTLVAGRCSAALAECLIEIKESKRYRALENTWEDFCKNRLGLSRATADRVILQYRRLGSTYSKLSSFVRIKPSEYQTIAEAVTEDGLSYGGQIIPFDTEHVPQLTQALAALQRQYAPELAPAATYSQMLARAEHLLQSALAVFEQLQALDLDEDGRLRLVVAAEEGRDRLERIRLTTTL